MSTIEKTFQQAQLAEAAYANFIGVNGGVITGNNAVIDALKAERKQKGSETNSF